MKVLSLVAVLILTSLHTAQAEEFPILAEYDAKAEQLVKLAQAAISTEEVSALQSGTDELITLGAAVMELYASKNPVCAEQFKIFISEIPAMKMMDLKAIHLRYHDGVGLPAAPRHCYFGRSQVVHPAMNFVRLNSALTDEVRASIIEETEEVIEHTERVRKNLINPPQG